MNPSATLPPPLTPPSPRRERRPRRARKLVLTGLSLTAEQVNSAVRGARDAVLAALSTLNTMVPQSFFSGAVVAGSGPVAGGFTLAMADVQEQCAARLGHLPSDPKVMRGRVALATTAKALSEPLQQLGVVLENIGNHAMQAGHADARMVYERAAVAAKVDPGLAAAIADFRAARARIGKKAAATRARRALGAKPVASPPPPVAPPSSTTTVTTAQH